MKLDFREIYDSGGEEEATPQPSAFQKWKTSRDFSATGSLRLNWQTPA